MVDWKKIPKIDAHIHLTPDDVIDANKGYESPFIDYGSVDAYLKIMENYQIEKAFVMPFNDPYMLSMDFTVETVHKNMKNMADRCKQKLYCFADIDIRKDINQTLQELDMTLQKNEFIGIKIHPSNTGYPIDGMYYAPIFEYAVENNILVEIHSYPRKTIWDDVCSPSRIKNVKQKYPNLRLSIAHLGGMQVQELVGVDAYFNLSAVLPDLVAEAGLEEANKILRKLKVDRLVFATDYPDSRCLKPEEIYDTYFRILERMDFTLEEARKICKENAIKMVGTICH